MHNLVNVLDASESCALKWLTLCYVHFTSIKKKKKKAQGCACWPCSQPLWPSRLRWARGSASLQWSREHSRFGLAVLALRSQISMGPAVQESLQGQTNWVCRKLSRGHIWARGQHGDGAHSAQPGLIIPWPVLVWGWHCRGGPS